MNDRNVLDLKVLEKWYDYWQKNGFFESTPKADKKPYVIVQPPPNVTGILHMGHVLNNTIQDILVRKARMQGFEVCWVPGTDHASIATESKVVAMLKDMGISKEDLTREQFLEYAWKWKNKYGATIVRQLKKLGISCDWKRNKFTLDTDLSASVIKFFVQLYDEGYIYRGNRIINWDPVGKTAISDDEVIHKEQDATLYYIRYNVSGSDEELIIATSRPETIMGDTAICVNPKDDRYKHLVGKYAIIPLIKKTIPIIADDYVNMKFGSGCLKVTPAHDINDAEIGNRHNLEFISVTDDEGKLNENAQIFIGLDRFIARKKIVEEIKSQSALVKEEIYKNRVGFSERTDAIIEPKISTQWFVKMTEITKPALQSVLQGDVNFHPKKFINMYTSWMENVKDWCISRQLWWGHRIPAYFLQDGTFVVAETKEKALAKAQKLTKNPNLTEKNLRQDEDVLDTWFSSCLWPISVFDGINSPNNEDIQYYYPTNDLVTAPEIIFFWVARMIIAGIYLRKTPPFKNVYFTGIVRDKQKRKMSKSLGNSPDAIALMDKYSVDGVRMGMMLCSPAGNDLLFDEKLCEQGRNFVNKIWNAFKFIKNFKTDDNTKLLNKDIVAIKWFKSKLNDTLKDIDLAFKSFRISEALMLIYKIIKDDFCSWYLEMIKNTSNPKDNRHGTSIYHKEVHTNTVDFFEILLKILHPFMPFITEELWQNLKKRANGDSICIHKWPQVVEIDKNEQNIIEHSKHAFDFITKIRALKQKVLKIPKFIDENRSKIDENHLYNKGGKIPKKDNDIRNKDSIDVFIISNHKDFEIVNKIPWLKMFLDNIKQLCNINHFSHTTKEDLNDINISSFIVDNIIFGVAVPDTTSNDLELKKVEKEVEYYLGFLKSVEKKLQNKAFVDNAPQKIFDIEIKKKKDAEAKIKSLKTLIK